MHIAQGPKYDLRVNPIYQVDWHNEASGKRVSATKRRIRWRFGFSNREALEEGLSGVDCRGEEHEVVLVWSLTSCKRLVIVDGQEVHFSTGRRTDSKFETSWTMFGGHMFKIIAYAAPPLFNDSTFRQFDLQLDGMSFHSFPKIFELGRGSHGRRVQPSKMYPERTFATPVARTPAISSEMDKQTRQAALVTPEVPERKEVLPALATSPAPPSFEDILSGPSPAPDTQDLFWNSAPQLTNEPYMGPPKNAFEHAQQQSHQLLQNSQQFYDQHSPRGVIDEYAPVSPPPRTFQDISKDILSAYSPDPSVPALTYAPHYSELVYQSSSSMAAHEDTNSNKQTQSKPQKPVLKPTMAPISIVEMEERDEAPVSEMDKAVKFLVNLDDISEVLETPEQAKTARTKAMNQPPKSKPLPPTTPQWNLGLRPSLNDIQKCAQSKPAPKKEIMRTHVFDPAAAQAGMMVVYGASSLPGAMGFGAGIQQLSHYNSSSYYPYQQQRMHAAY